MQKIIALVALIFSVTFSAEAVYVLGDSNNTNRPTDGGGWDSVGDFYPTRNEMSSWAVVGNIIGRWHFVTVEHAGGLPGDKFWFRGTCYTVTDRYATNDLCVYRVDQPFPNNSWAQIYTNTDEMNKEFYVHGFGPSKGEMVTSTNYPTPLTITKLCPTPSTDTLCVTGGDIGTKFNVERSVDRVNWTVVSTNNCVVDINNTQVSVPSSNCCVAFYRTKAVDLTVVTNGWRTGTLNNTRRWGKNNIENLDEINLVSYFNQDASPNESSTGSYDSGGGAYTMEAGVWKIVGVTWGGQEGPWTDQSGQTIYGPMVDLSGLSISGMKYSFGSFIKFSSPTSYIRISSYAGWLNQFTGSN